MLCRDKYCTLIVICTKYSIASYFDSASQKKKKDYTRIRGVLNEALEGYAKKGCPFVNKGECIKDDKHVFKHVLEFPCVKEPATGGAKEAFYAMHHLKGFVRDCQNLTLPSSFRAWAENLARRDDDDLREDFHRIQVKLSEIIVEDVNTRGGVLKHNRGLTKREIENILRQQGDNRTWMTKDGYLPFPKPSVSSSQH